MPATTPPIEGLSEFLQTAFGAVRTTHRAAHALPFTYCAVYSPILCISLQSLNAFRGESRWQECCPRCLPLRFNQRLIIRFLGNLTEECECPWCNAKIPLCKSMNLFHSNVFNVRGDFSNRNVTTKVNLAPCKPVHTRFASL